MGINYAKYDLLIEACMDWIAQRWTKSMIRAELNENFGKDIDWRTCQSIIKAAKNEIKRKYNIEAGEYRGHQISLYEFIIRERKYYDEFIKVADRIKCLERLDKLFNLEGIQIEDADAIAGRIRDALHEIDHNTFTEVPAHAIDKLKRLREAYNDAQRDAAPKPRSEPAASAETTNGDIPIGGQDGQDAPPTAESAEGKDEQVQQDSLVDLQAPSSGTTEECGKNKTVIPDTEDCEDVASIDDLPEEIRKLISNPDKDKMFEDFAKRKKRRKEID